MFSQITTWTTKHFFLRQDRNVLDQQFKLLDAKFEKIKHEQQLESDSSLIVSKLDGLFKQKQSWTCLSQIELFLVSLYSREQTEMELKIKLLEAREKLKPQEVAFFETEIQRTEGRADNKILLNNLNEKLQLADDLENLQNNYIALTRLRTSFLFLVAILMFFAVDQFPGLAKWLSVEKGQRSDAIITAMSAGWLGTCFSMLMSLKSKLTTSTLQELKVMHRMDYIFTRTIIGLISGLLVFYFVESKMLSGSMFPVIGDKEGVYMGESSFALLIVWSFLSGFSEKLVPDLLAKTEQKAQAAKA